MPQQLATPPHAHAANPKKKSPLPYFTFNPGCLDDENAWKYRQLQQLCKKLELRASGKREELVRRLRQWHTVQFDENKPYWPGSNFSMLQVDVGGAQSVSPSLLSPLVKKARRRKDGTPISILSPRAKTNRPKHTKRLSFSVFNGVKIIPARPGVLTPSPPPMQRSQSAPMFDYQDKENQSSSGDDDLYDEPTQNDSYEKMNGEDAALMRDLDSCFDSLMNQQQA